MKNKKQIQINKIFKQLMHEVFSNLTYAAV